MKPASLNLICFSPTQTTQRTLKAIGDGVGLETVHNINVTSPGATPQINSFNKEQLVIFGSPVYSGRIPTDAADRLKQFKGDRTPAVIVVLYGNREYEDALLELSDLVKEQGFVPVAGAAFIGEHSYSTAERPIAVNRPDTDDLKQARQFGEAVINKLKTVANGPEGMLKEIPGNNPYKEPKTFPDIAPTSDESLCTQCLDCVDACPTGAIDKNEPVKTNAAKCIRCCACVKICPTGARVFDHPVIKEVSQWLFTNFSQRKEPELFL